MFSLSVIDAIFYWNMQISKLQQEFNEKELSIRTHHKEELHRLELHAENELRDVCNNYLHKT